jgi:hypothetical protein
MNLPLRVRSPRSGTDRHDDDEAEKDLLHARQVDRIPPVVSRCVRRTTGT